MSAQRIIAQYNGMKGDTEGGRGKRQKTPSAKTMENVATRCYDAIRKFERKRFWSAETGKGSYV